MNINKLKEYLEHSKLSKKQFAEQCGVTRVTIDNALRGADIRVSILESIAKVLKVPVGALFDESEATDKPSVVSTIHARQSEVSVPLSNGAAQYELVSHLKSLLEEKERTITVQQQLIESLRMQLEREIKIL